MTKKNTKKNTVDCTRVSWEHIDEIDGIIKTLTVYDLIDACDYIRENGVSSYDYETDKDVTLPLDMVKIHAVTGTPACASLESVCKDWFSKLLGGRKDIQAYKDFVYWYNTHVAILENDRDNGKTPIIPYCDIKYLALEDTVNCMCDVLLHHYDEDPDSIDEGTYKKPDLKVVKN